MFFTNDEPLLFWFMTTVKYFLTVCSSLSSSTAYMYTFKTMTWIALASNYCPSSTLYVAKKIISFIFLHKFELFVSVLFAAPVYSLLELRSIHVLPILANEREILLITYYEIWKCLINNVHIVDMIGSDAEHCLFLEVLNPIENVCKLRTQRHVHCIKDKTNNFGWKLAWGKCL